MSNGRRYAPVLIATVTPQGVETREGATGAYTVMPGALVSRAGKEDVVRTVMAFGKPNETVAGLLESGVPVSLALRFHGGAMKVVGLPRIATADARTPSQIVCDILKDAGMDDDMAKAAYDAMLDGSSDRPSDDAIDLDPDMLDSMGTVVLPILDAGIALEEAMDIAERILASTAAETIEDAATMIRQNSARDFV